MPCRSWAPKVTGCMAGLRPRRAASAGGDHDRHCGWPCQQNSAPVATGLGIESVRVDGSWPGDRSPRQVSSSRCRGTRSCFPMRITGKPDSPSVSKNSTRQARRPRSDRCEEPRPLPRPGGTPVARTSGPRSRTPACPVFPPSDLPIVQQDAPPTATGPAEEQPDALLARIQRVKAASRSSPAAETALLATPCFGGSRRATAASPRP